MRAFGLSLVLFFCGALEARVYWQGDPDIGGRSPRLARRRFGQESSTGVEQLYKLPGCPGNICATLAGQAIKPVLAAAGSCEQQDHADLIIDAALDMSNGISSQDTRNQMIEIAIKYRKAEKNTRPIYGTGVTNRNSLYCQKEPKHSQLSGLVQAQDPANDKTLFFDPQSTVNGGTVVLGTRRDTYPLHGLPPGVVISANSAPPNGAQANTTSVGSGTVMNTTTGGGMTMNPTSMGGGMTTSPPGGTSLPFISSTSIGSCGDMRIEFGQGFPAREPKEMAYMPLDSKHSHPAALNLHIITEYMCDELHNSCGVKQGEPVFDDCKKIVDGIGKAVGNGSAADLWNHQFGYATTYATQPANGRGTGGKGDGISAKIDQTRGATPTANQNDNTMMMGGSTTMNMGMDQSTNNASLNAAPASFGNASLPFLSIGNLMGCTDLRVEFGKGFPGKEQELSYQPLDNSHHHGSALNMGIIIDFLCDELVNKCGLKNQDKVFMDCKTVVKSIGTVKANGAAADQWNAQLGYTTNYGKIPATGPGTGGKGDGQIRASPASGTLKGNPTTSPSDNTKFTTGIDVNTTGTTPSGTKIGNTVLRIQPGGNVTSAKDLPFIDPSTLGNCSDMRLEYGTSLQGRTADQFAYEPVSLFHRTGSAFKIGIQIQYMCDQLRNKCFIKDTDPQFIGCKQVEAFIGTLGNGTRDGFLSDLWNSRFGHVTDYEHKPANGTLTGGINDGSPHLKDPGVPQSGQNREEDCDDDQPAEEDDCDA